jgi:hypothetical protein
MSQGNVEIFKRGAEAWNRRDVETMLGEVLDEMQGDLTEIRDLGDRLVTFGHLRGPELIRFARG